MLEQYFRRRHVVTRLRAEPLGQLLEEFVAVSMGEPDWNALLPDVWIAAHPEHFLHYRRDEAKAAARSRRRRRAGRRANASGRSRSP